MAEPTEAEKEAQTETKFKKWVNEVLDERETKAAAEAEAAEKARLEEEAKKPKPFSIIGSLFGE